MPRRFNTAGPNDPEDHHTLPVLARLPDVHRLIDEKAYFVLHAPRQSGKTTALLALARELTSGGRYVAVVLSMAAGAPFREQHGMAEDAILDAWRGTASRRLAPAFQPPAWPEAPPGHRISRALQAWAEEAPRPLVVLLDEIDALEGAALASVLRQLRDGFPDRPHHFPWSLMLAGMRDVPDYNLAVGPGGHAGAEGAFDIRSESITLQDFSRDGVAALYRRHTEETGQVFLPVAIDRAYRLTRGQPWLVNALGRLIVEAIVQDRATAINADHVEDARGLLVRGQRAHFDGLAEQLHEPRLRAILEPMLRGAPLGDVSDEDRRLALDLGLVRASHDGALAIANPIYREVLVRLLASGTRAAPPHLTATWVPAEGIVDQEPSPVEAEVPPTIVSAAAAPSSLALASAARAPLESFPPEELTEWFRPVSRALPLADRAPPPAPPATGPAASPRERRRSQIRRGVAIGGAACALVAAVVWLAGSSERPAAATPSSGAPDVALMSARTLASTETPHADPAPATSQAAWMAALVPAPRPSSEPSASRASTVRITRAPARAPQPATSVHVVPTPPTLPPPDDEKLRRQLEPRVWGGEASVEEIRMLKAICSHTGDRACRDRAAEMLKKTEL